MKKIAIFLVVILIAVYRVYQHKNEPPSSILDKEQIAQINNPTISPSPNNTKNAAPLDKKARLQKLKESKNINFKAQNEIEESAELITILLKKYNTDLDLNSENFLHDLEAIGLEPLRTVTQSEASGDLAIVRTKNVIPGTRYLHAQFFTDENGKEFLQHMSFEMSPKESFARAKELAQAYLSSEVESEVSKEKYQLWKMKNGYNIYVQEMGSEDLKDDPFNAYTAADVGTKRIVIEQEIHPDGDGHSH